MKDVPVTVSLKSAEPTTADVGLIDVIVGVGLDIDGGALDEYPPPPHPDNNSAANTAETKTRAMPRFEVIRWRAAYSEELLSLADL